MAVSVFDSSIVPGSGDPDVSNATPGVVWAHQRNVADGNNNVELVDGSDSNSEFHALQRLPPSYITSGGDAYVTTLRFGSNGALQLRLHTVATGDTGSGAGPQLTDAAETNLALMVRGADGTTWSVRLSALVVDDTEEPYAWLSAGFSNAQRLALQASGAQAVLVDTSDANIDYDNLQVESAQEIPDAVAPTATITSPAEIDERVTLAQFATVGVSDGTYDTLAYAWSDGGAGGTVGASGANLHYAAPDVSALTSVTLSCTVTASGTGTNAKDGTSATVTATRTIMVRPESDNEQVFALPGSTHTESSLTHRWEFANGERPPLINALKTNDSDARFLAGIVIGNNNFVELLFAASQTENAATRNDLSDTFETDGAFTLVADNRTLSLDLDSQDLTEPYRWQPSPTTPVSSFRTGVGSGDGVSAVLTLDTGIRPDAVAPTVTIGAVTEVDEDDTLALSATVSGGTYDSVTYSWSVQSGGGTITGSGLTATYSPPDVTQDTSVTVRLAALAEGDGTLAADGTDDTSTDLEVFTVRVVLPDATAPTTFAITAVDGVDEDETLSLTVTHSGGVYDTIDYIWQILFSGGGTITGSGASVTYNPPDVSADTEITVAVTGTARGTGTLAADGTSASTNDQEAFTVRRVVLLTLADIAVPDGRMLVGTGSLIEAGANEPYGDSSTVLDGDDPPDLGSDDLNPTRMWMASGTPGTRWRISDNGTGDIEAIFSAGGALEDYQVHIQPSFTDVVSLARDAINATPSTAARILWDMPDAEEDLLNAIADGDRWLFFLTQPETIPTQALATSATAGNPTASFNLSAVSPPATQALSVAAEAGNPTASFNLRAVAPSDAEQLSVAAESGDPTAAFNLRAVSPPATQALSVSAEAGDPTAAFNLRAVAPLSVALSMSATAGDPTATFNARVIAPPATQALSMAAEAGDPTATFNLRAIAPGAPQALSMAAGAGDPTATFNLRAVAPAAADQLSVSAEAGFPRADFNLRAVAPPVTQALSFAAEAGSPTASFALTAVDPSDAQELSFSAAAGDPTARFNARVVAPPATLALSVTARAGDPTARFNLSGLAPESVPGAPTGLAASEVGRDSATLTWNAPDDVNPAISRYEVRIGTGAWISTGSIGTSYRLTGLATGTEYSVTVRAVNSEGNGAASDAVTFRTLAILAPGVPIFPRFEVVAEMHLDLLWEPPINDGGGAITAYEALLVDEVGQTIGWESAGDGDARQHRFRGLREGGRYRAVVRARNLAGTSDASEQVEGAPCVMPAAVTLPPGATIPLGDHDRQSLIVRLDGKDCRIRVWWQPSDSGWWASLEVPVNSPAVTGRRLSLNSGILDRIEGVLNGNLVLRDLGGAGVEPPRSAWRNQTHALRWEPNE